MRRASLEIGSASTKPPPHQALAIPTPAEACRLAASPDQTPLGRYISTRNTYAFTNSETRDVDSCSVHAFSRAGVNFIAGRSAWKHAAPWDQFHQPQGLTSKQTPPCGPHFSSDFSLTLLRRVVSSSCSAHGKSGGCDQARPRIPHIYQ